VFPEVSEELHVPVVFILRRKIFWKGTRHVLDAVEERKIPNASSLRSKRSPSP
jgi:hypothetical protein